MSTLDEQKSAILKARKEFERIANKLEKDGMDASEELAIIKHLRDAQTTVFNLQRIREIIPILLS